MELSRLPEPSWLVSYSHMHSVNKELLQTKMQSQKLFVAEGLVYTSLTPQCHSTVLDSQAGYTTRVHPMVKKSQPVWFGLSAHKLWADLSVRYQRGAAGVHSRNAEVSEVLHIRELSPHCGQARVVPPVLHAHERMCSRTPCLINCSHFQRGKKCWLFFFNRMVVPSSISNSP